MFTRPRSRYAPLGRQPSTMADNDDWTTLLDGHPIFSRSKGIIKDESFELSLDSIPDFSNNEEADENTALSGRRQVMCMKDADLLLASGSEVRMASLGDAKMSGGSARNYKASCTCSKFGFWCHS